MKFEVFAVPDVKTLKEKLEDFRKKNKTAKFLGMTQSSIVIPHKFPGAETTYTPIIQITICYE